GRLQTDRDKARVLDGLEGAASSTGAGLDRAAMDNLLSSLGKRQFVLHNVHEKQPVLFETRWTLSYLRGPLGRDEVRRLTATPRSAATTTAAAAQAPEPRTKLVEPSGTRGTPGTASAPVLDPSIEQFFVGGGNSYVPMLVGVARVAYSDAKNGLDETR